MEFREVPYYILISIFSLAATYILIFKTELLANRWVAGVVVAIIYITLGQLYKRLSKDGN